MIVAGLLALGAVSLMVVAPVVLSAGRWHVRRPRLALALWFGALAAGVALVAAAAALVLAASLGLWVLATPEERVVADLAAWIGLALAGALTAGVAGSAQPLGCSMRLALDRLVRDVVRRDHLPGCTVVWIDAHEPLACAVPGRTPEIVLSTGLRALLTPAQVQAVVAHEYAHVRAGHGLLVRLAEVNARLTPGVLPAGRHLERATLRLVELIADDAAARQAGAANLANALAAMGRACGDPSLELRALRLTLRRWPPAWRRRVPPSIRMPSPTRVPAPTTASATR